MAAMVLSSEQIPNRADEYQNRVEIFKYEYHNTGRYHQVHFNEERKTEKMEKVDKKHDNIIKMHQK